MLAVLRYMKKIIMILFMLELRQTTIKTWFKSNNPLGASGGKLGNLNIH
jgi:hypothetical protein